ncbi:MAG: 3-phosphoshikimate 1-carboxyvinyltransferase [Limnohabitans sp.]|nr:3-phosphoshikimate 1-carboxyvinyltransferase [Limnohabitans sp.]
MDPLEIARLQGPVRAVVPVPGSKSLSNRHLILAALASQATRLHGLLSCDDCDLLLAAMANIGVAYRVEGSTVVLHPELGDLHAHVHLGDGGTPTRFMMALAAARNMGVTEIDGSARMRERPIAEGVQLLRELGAHIEYLEAEGRLPVRVAGGEISGGNLVVGRTASSQFISAVMLIAPRLRGGVRISFSEEPTSASYIALSLAALAAAGVHAEVSYRPTPVDAHASGLAEVFIPEQVIRGGDVIIEPDASSAVYPAALAAMSGGSVVIPRLPRRSVQPDAYFFDDLALRGARVEEVEGGLRVTGRGVLRGLESNFAQAPDAAVMGMVLAACCDRPSLLTGLGTLRVKESDRIESVAAGLRALGGCVETGPDWVRVFPLPAVRDQGGCTANPVQPVVIDTVNDHRIAMAFAVLGLVRGGIAIANPRCVTKSWPEFWHTVDLLQKPASGENGTA